MYRILGRRLRRTCLVSALIFPRHPMAVLAPSASVSADTAVFLQQAERTEPQPALQHDPRSEREVQAAVAGVRRDVLQHLKQTGERKTGTVRATAETAGPLAKIAGTEDAGARWKVRAKLEVQKSGWRGALASAQRTAERFRAEGKTLHLSVHPDVLMEDPAVWALIALMARFPDALALDGDSDALLHERADEMQQMPAGEEAEPIVGLPVADGDDVHVAAALLGCVESVRHADAAYALMVTERLREWQPEDPAVKQDVRVVLARAIAARLGA